MSEPSTQSLVPFAYGFRPFFLLCGLFAVVGLAAWLWIYHYAVGQSPLSALPAHLWHGHEMLFGFIVAAIAGFLLTAVPSWTGARGFAGTPLVALAALWLAGRLVFSIGASAPPTLLAVVELAFLPTLALTIAPALVRTRNRNTALLVVLLALWLTDVAFFVGLVGNDAGLAVTALRVALDIVLVLITVIGGRIVPAFTANALRRAGWEGRIRSGPWLERGVITAMVAVLVTDALSIPPAINACVAAVAGVLHLWRQSGWQGHRTGSQPIVWVLHSAYLWLPLGLLLKAVNYATGATWSAHWVHALGLGAAGTMILAVMSRAILGHTGRELAVARPVVWAYALILLAGLVRVFGPSLLPMSYPVTIVLAGLAWVVSFSLFLWIYAPMLMRPRLDGRPG